VVGNVRLRRGSYPRRDLGRRSTLLVCVGKRCRDKDYDLIYLNKKICDRCWFRHAEDKEKLKKHLNIPASYNGSTDGR